MHPRWPFPALTTEAGWEVSCLSDGTSSLLGEALLSQQPSFTSLGPGRSWLRCQPRAQDRASGSLVSQGSGVELLPNRAVTGTSAGLWNAGRSHRCPAGTKCPCPCSPAGGLCLSSSQISH